MEKKGYFEIKDQCRSEMGDIAKKKNLDIFHPFDETLNISQDLSLCSEKVSFQSEEPSFSVYAASICLIYKLKV